MNTEYRLQLLRSGSVFSDNAEALTYIAKNLASQALEGELAVAFYGEKTNPNVILCIGSGEQTVFTIDIEALKEQIAALEGSTSTDSATLKEAVETIDGIIKASGLTKTELKEGVEISYDPDSKDEIIGDATTLAEAIQLLSTYAQNVSSSSQFDVEDSKSITLEKKEGTLKAYLRISTLGETSKSDDDDNIIGVFSDGVYAVTHLDYDDEKKTLTFITSGYDENGEFKRDANTQVIELGERTQYEEYNKGHNIEVIVDNEEMKISADAKISDGDDNILVSKSDGLFVKGTASNIKYHNTTVREAINDLYDKVADAAKKTEYVDSDTVKFTTKEDANGELNVSADVKLASNNSINIGDGGLNVNLVISVDAAKNTLTVKLGDTETTYDLPDAKIIDHIEFKDGDLILWYDNDKYVTIPMEGLISHYVFNNDNEHYVHLDADLDSNGVYQVYATVKLRSNDNLISHDSSGELYVSKEEIEAIVLGVSEDIIERLKAVEEKVEALEKEIATDETAFNALAEQVKTNEAAIEKNSDAINDIQTQMSTDEASLKAIQAQVETNTSNISANTNDIADIKTQMATDEANFTALSEQVKTNVDDIATLKVEVQEVEAEIKVDEEKFETLESEVAKAEEQIETNTTAIITLNTTVTQVQNDLTTETTRATNEEEKLQTQIDSLSEQLSGDEQSILAEAKAYTDVETQRATAAEEKLEEEVGTINNTMSSIHIEKASDNDLQYVLYVGEADRGHINIPEDAFLKSVTYDESNKALVFDFLVKKDDGTTEEEVVTISISDMVSDYTQGDGIHIDDNVISIHINSQSEPYLTVDGDGLCLSGVDSLIKDAEESILTSAQEYTDTKVGAVEEQIAVDEETLNKKIESVSVRKGDDDLHYYVVVDGKDVEVPIEILNVIMLESSSYNPDTHTLTLVFETTQGYQTLTINLSDLVDTYENGVGLNLDGNVFSIKINDDANTEGYLKLGNGGLYVSGVDAAIKTATDALEEKISEVASEICDAGDGLKKVDVEGGHKFEVHINENSQEYLTVGEDGLNLKGVAGSDELNAVDERVKNIESTYATKYDIDELDGEIGTNAYAIEKLEESFDAYKFHTADTSTVELTMKEVESEGSSRELSAKAVISSQANNNIIDNGGLYAVSDFDYNAATNVITFTNSNGVHEFTVNTDYSLVEGGYYDSTNHAVVLIVKDSSGETHEISIPIADLIYDIDVHNDVNDPVELEISTDATTGAKVITATLRISGLTTNLIETNEGSLYASNRAADMYCFDSLGTEQTIQEAISEFYSDINTINNTLENLGDDVSSLEGLATQVNTNTTNIANLDNRTTSNEAAITILQNQVEGLSQNIVDINSAITSIESTVKELSDQITSIQETLDCIGNVCESVSEKGDVQTRLKAVEEVVEELIDFEEY